MMLLWLIVLPLAGGLAAWLASRWSDSWPRRISLLFACGQLALAVALWAHAFGSGSPAPYAVWRAELKWDWIPQLGISFHLAMDGVSMVLLLLTALLGVLAVAASWTEVRERVGLYHLNLMWVLAGITGVFLAADLFLFYFFWELMLVPMYFLIDVWGHEARHPAAIKFFIFTQLSGLFMLTAILGLYFVHGRSTGVYTFGYRELLGTDMSSATATWLMLGFLIAFVVKLGAAPFHTWLPDAHTQAPTAASVILAGLLLKTGGYGLLRFAVPLFPEAASSFAPLMMAAGVFGILYGAVMAFSQTDLKRLVAYTSVSHMGFVLVGVYAWNTLALRGTLVQMVAHGLGTGGLFIVVGALQERIHTRDMGRMGGLWATAPRMGAVALFLALAAMALPSMGSFVGEFLVLLGAWRVSIPIASVAIFATVASVIYALRMIQAAFHGPNKDGWSVRDYSLRETGVAAVLIAAILWIGLWPGTLLDTAGRALDTLWRYGPLHGQAVTSGAILAQMGTAQGRASLVRLASDAVGTSDLTALLPILVPAGAAVLCLAALAFRRRHRLIVGLCLTALVGALVLLPVAWSSAPRQVTPLLRVDGYALLLTGLILAATLAAALFAAGYLGKLQEAPEEFYVLLLLAATGGAVLVASVHFASFLLGLEVLTISLYTLIAYERRAPLSVEAGIKYLILAAFSTAFLIFGMALIYANAGTMELPRVALSLSAPRGAGAALILPGLALILVGLGFKLSLVPFHLWAPDVYQGAPAPVSGFIATVSKGAVFALLLRYLAAVHFQQSGALVFVLSLIAILSMFVGNFLALLQSNVKRILAYSSIAHLGYLLVALLASGPLAVTAACYYLAAYFVTTLGAWGVVTALSVAERDAENLSDYRGLAWRRPWLAGVFTTALLSLIGIPVTAGFIGKFYVLAAGVSSGLWLLVLALIVNSAIGLFYYLRVILVMFSRPGEEEVAESVPGPSAGSLPEPAVSLGGGLALAGLTALLVWLGVYPSTFIAAVQAALRGAF